MSVPERRPLFSLTRFQFDACEQTPVIDRFRRGAGQHTASADGRRARERPSSETHPRGAAPSRISRAERPDAETLAWVGSRMDGGLGMKFVTVSPDNKDLTGSKRIRFIRRSCCAMQPTRTSNALSSATVSRGSKRLRTRRLERDFLRTKKPKRLLMIGAGAQAPVHLKVMCAEFPSLERVDVWNRDQGRAASTRRSARTRCRSSGFRNA